MSAPSVHAVSVLDRPGPWTGHEVAVAMHIGDTPAWVGYGGPDTYPKQWIAVSELHTDDDGIDWITVAEKSAYDAWLLDGQQTPYPDGAFRAPAAGTAVFEQR